MAEAILNSVGAARFHAFSAGAVRTAPLNPYVMDFLSTHRMPVRVTVGDAVIFQRSYADAISAARNRSLLMQVPATESGPQPDRAAAQAVLEAARGEGRVLLTDPEAKAKFIRDTLKSGKSLESADFLNSELIRRLSEQLATFGH